MLIQSPRDLFLYDLCSMYDVEQKLVQMLPVLAQESLDPQARDTFKQHEQETRQHVRNLERCFQILGSQPGTFENNTVAGLKKDHNTFLQQQPPREALALFDLRAGYESECLEIAAYHNLIDAASNLGLQDCVQLFQLNLQQEMNASKQLDAIAHQYSQQQIQAVQGTAPGRDVPIQPNPQMVDQPPVAVSPQMPGQPYATTNPQGPNPPSPEASPQMQSQPGTAASPQMPNQASGSAEPPQSPSAQLREGMQVVGADMSNVGHVREVRENDFLVDIPLHRDIYVPFSAVRNVDANRVVLNIPGDQIYNMNWPKPALM